MLLPSARYRSLTMLMVGSQWGLQGGSELSKEHYFQFPYCTPCPGSIQEGTGNKGECSASSVVPAGSAGAV